jgi:hypothetical protein
MGIEKLLADQAALESRFGDFVASLDGRRIVTLKRLIEEPLSTHTLSAPWLNHELFCLRIETAWGFLESLDDHPRLPKHQRLTFLQSSPACENLPEHRKLLSNEFSGYGEMYRNRIGEAEPPEAWYFHTNPLWSFKLDGSWDKKNRTIPALGGFLHHSGFDSQVVRGSNLPLGDAFVLGLRVPDWPSMLGVTNDTATEYFARIVIHDLGHAWLPHLDSRTDSLHNAVMLSAVEAKRKVCESVWEQIICGECTDPFFYIDGFELLRQCNEAALGPLQKYLLKKLRRYYDSKRHRTMMRWLWGINPKWPLDEQRQQLKKVLAEMHANGFERYKPDWKPPE